MLHVNLSESCYIYVYHNGLESLCCNMIATLSNEVNLGVTNDVKWLCSSTSLHGLGETLFLWTNLLVGTAFGCTCI